MFWGGFFVFFLLGFTSKFVVKGKAKISGFTSGIEVFDSDFSTAECNL